jgi:hypothetical protein
MRQRFSSLSIVALVVFSALLAVLSSNGQSSDDDQKDSTSRATPPRTSNASGDVLLDSAIAAVDAHESLTAKLRLQVHLMGHHLFGPGAYLQQGRGADRKIRLEMSVNGSAGRRLLTHVNDGHELWVLEDFSETQQLRFVDLDRLANVQPESTVAPMSSQLNELGLSGLPGLMKNVQASFQFGPAIKIQWNGMTVWAMRGVWRTEVLARLMSIAEGDAAADRKQLLSKLPDRAPTEVGLLLDTKSLLPFRVEFLRPAKRLGKSNKQNQTPVATLELFEVRFDEEIDETQFKRPSDIAPVDITKQLIRTARQRESTKK